MGEELTWGPLDGPADLVGLAERCHAADGGAAENTVRRYLADGVITTSGRTSRGSLVAAAAVLRQEPGPVVTGMVDPAHRGQSIGGRLLDWALAAAATVGDPVTVETEGLTEGAARLFASRGLRQVFAEDVMRFDLSDEPPAVPLPVGVRLTVWTPELAARFFAVYEAAFRDRPGFPGWPAERWVVWTAGDDEFRPQWSVLATGPDGDDAGFVTCAQGWIVQVGVVPSWRGRGLGAALMAEALHRMRADGATEVLLDVNADNPGAARLYAALGFTLIGRRAKFQPT
jgi:mycothiol synthase